MNNLETSFLKFDDKGEKHLLTLMDGSKWFVNPGDLPTVATWQLTEKIKIEDSKDGSMFSYNLTNLDVDEDKPIQARKIN